MDWSIWTQILQLSYFARCFPKVWKHTVAVLWNYYLRAFSENMLFVFYCFVLVVLASLIPEGQGIVWKISNFSYQFLMTTNEPWNIRTSFSSRIKYNKLFDETTYVFYVPMYVLLSHFVTQFFEVTGSRTN